MKLAVSNLAWDFSENNEKFTQIRDCQIGYVEGVLSKLGNWDEITNEVLKDYKLLLDNNNLKVKSVQSIFYNYDSNGLHDSDNIIYHIKRLIEFCEVLGVDIMVLGSPNLRKSTDNLYDKLSETFKKIDEILESTGIQILIEPNTKSYGGSYFHNLNEIVDFIISNQLRNVRTMIDTHNLILEGYNPIFEYIKFEKFISHIHISESELKPLHNENFHKSFAKILKDMDYSKIITYELKPTEDFVNTVGEFYKIYS
jgi:sugar phosphate isomerase/epimerase